MTYSFWSPAWVCCDDAEVVAAARGMHRDIFTIIIKKNKKNGGESQT